MFNVWVTPEMRVCRFFAMTWAGAFHRLRFSFRWLADYQMVAVTSAPAPPIVRHEKEEKMERCLSKDIGNIRITVRVCANAEPRFCMDIPTMLACVIHISLASQRLSGGCGALSLLDGFPAVTASPAPNCGKGIEPDVVPSECVPVSRTTCFKPTPRHWW